MTILTMADHGELVKDMPDVEKLPTVERMKLARKRRQQQLKKYAEYEKKQDKLEKNNKKNAKKPGAAAARKKTDLVRFPEDVIFLEATARNDLGEVTALLQQGVSPDIANEDGLTALHQSCIDDCEDMVVLLLHHGANANARDRELWTPLHAAATCGHSRICQHLIRKNADLLAVNSEGNMPYDICEDEQTLELIETSMANAGVTQDLIDQTRVSLQNDMLNDLRTIGEAGGNLEVKDRQGAVPLHAAAANGYYIVAAYLLDKGVDVNPTDVDGWAPAHAAACWGHMDVLRLLASHGADLELRTRSDETLFDLCEDEALRAQIEEIKRQAQTYREQRNTLPSHRHSSSHSLHGSSVRRHSMREKRRLSLVEAKQEAKLFNVEKYDVPVTNIDDVEILPASSPAGEESLSVPGSDHGARALVHRGSALRFSIGHVDDGHVLLPRGAEPSAIKQADEDRAHPPSKHKFERRLSAVHTSQESEHALRALALDYAFAAITTDNECADGSPVAGNSRVGAVSGNTSSVAPGSTASAMLMDDALPGCSDNLTAGAANVTAALDVATARAATPSNGVPAAHTDELSAHASLAYSNNNTVASAGDCYEPSFVVPMPTPGEEPLKKFTSHTHEIVGGYGRRRCCTVM